MPLLRNHHHHPVPSFPMIPPVVQINGFFVPQMNARDRAEPLLAQTVERNGVQVVDSWTDRSVSVSRGTLERPRWHA